MNKAHFFLLAIAFTIFSCNESREKSKPESSGKINNIAVIIDDELWNGEVGDTIRNKFASPVIGLAQEEPLFTINQYPVKLLEGFMTNGRNVIVIKKEPLRKFKVVSDDAATPQHVIHISGHTVSEILSIIEENAPAIIRIMKDAEIAETQKRIDTSLLDVARIKKKFNISLKIPSDYQYVLESKKLLWLKKEIISGNTSILIYEVPPNYIAKNSNTIGRIIKMRDSVGSLYIHGTLPGTRMITEEAYAPYLKGIELDGLPTFETRGTWEMKNDFMSGPFINYCIPDRRNQRVLVIEGFCYAPSKEKRDLMHELEAIIKSVEIAQKKIPKR